MAKQGKKSSASNVTERTENGKTFRAHETRLTVPVGSIVPGEEWQPQESKMEKLRASFATLGDWTEDIHVTPGKIAGTYEAWEQRHRVAILKEVYGPEHRVPIVVEDLTPKMKLQRKAESNGEGYGSSPADYAEIAQTVVAQFAQSLPELVASGEVSPIDPQATAYYDAKSATPYKSVDRVSKVGEDGKREPSPLPPYAYTSAMVEEYSGVNRQSMQRSLALLHGLSQVKVAPASVVDGLNRDQAVAVGKIATSMREVSEGAVTAGERKLLTRVAEEMRRMDRGEEAGVMIDGKLIDPRKASSAVEIATAIRRNGDTLSFVEPADPDADAGKDGDEEDPGPTGPTPAEKRRERVNAIVASFDKIVDKINSGVKAKKGKFTANEFDRIDKAIAKVQEASKQGRIKVAQLAKASSKRTAKK